MSALADAHRRVLEDCASADLPVREQCERRFVSSFEDYRRTIGDLRALGYVAGPTDAITPKGRLALRGAL